MKVAEADFLETYGGCWTARQAAEFSVVNVHAIEIPAQAGIIFPQLGSRDLLVHRPLREYLLGFLGAIGKLFQWDTGLDDPKPQAIERVQYFAFIHVMKSRHTLGDRARRVFSENLLGLRVNGIMRVFL